jgi:glyoxylase-like metal-dependent hydrolase (beta-lactamase superfamily II)
MKIAENIEALQLRMNFTGGESVIHPALLWDSEGATLVDTGMPGQLEELRVEVEGAGVGFGTIRRVVLTHQDVDHIGGYRRSPAPSEASWRSGRTGKTSPTSRAPNHSSR